MLIDRWMDKEAAIHMCIYIYIYVYTHTQWNITQHRQEWNLALCNNMDAPWGYYATWNTFDTERQILYLFVECKQRKHMNKHNWTETES